MGARESVVSCVPVVCVLSAFRARVSSHVTVCCSNVQYVLAMPEPGTQMCRQFVWSRVRFERPVVPPCDSGPRVPWFEVRNS